jgi:hypothetical protein
MKIFRFLLITCFLLSYSFCLTKSRNNTDESLAKNQLRAFPNTNQPPVSSDNLKPSSFTAPLLSRALSELEPKRKYKLNEFLETVKYTLYKMTRGEAELLFSFIDSNRDDLIDSKEFDDFKTLYIMPFEACDANNKMLLNEAQFKTCFEADPKRKQVTFRRRYEQSGNTAKIIMDTLSTRGATLINIFDYILYRRALYSWTRCQSSGKYIAKSHFKCALSMFIPNKYLNKLDASKIYEAGLQVAYDKNLIELDFVAYLRVTYFTFVFSIFNESNSQNLPFLERVRFIRSIQEDRLPKNFEESEINFIYSLTANQKVMEFSSFCFFFNLHRLFFQYSLEKPLLLTKKEVLRLLNDTQAPKHIVNFIDESISNFSQAEYQEASLILGKKRVNEAIFYSFKQDSSVETAATHSNSTIFSNNFSLKADKKNRELFFSIMCGSNKQYWDKESFYRAFAHGSLFAKVVEMTGDAGKTATAISPKALLNLLPRAYDLSVPSINSMQRKNLIFYKSIQNEIKIDLLSFLEIEHFSTKLAEHNLTEDSVIEETIIKIIMKDYGMTNIPDTVLDLSIKGFDALRRREFKSMDLFKNLITVHAAAGEIERTHKHFEDNNLKDNEDISRQFPQVNRRFLNSPLV